MSLAKVLFVDDEVPFVEALTKRLTKRDLEIIPAYSGDEALKKLAEQTTIEVVILDVKMPGMDGIETLQEIKKKFPLVEVIMLTGHATVESAIEGMKLGAFDYLMKPCGNRHAGRPRSRRRRPKSASHEEKIMQARLKEITMRRA
ncbi:MAG: response regulator [Desulfobacterales bacterium]|nr:response regulator [Desulfobacterales bacterium]